MCAIELRGPWVISTFFLAIFFFVLTVYLTLDFPRVATGGDKLKLMVDSYIGEVFSSSMQNATKMASKDVVKDMEINGVNSGSWFSGNKKD